MTPTRPDKPKARAIAADVLPGESDWGDSLRFLTVCDKHYLPGAYSLINSAYDNGFSGQFDVFLTEASALKSAVPAPGVHYKILPKNDPNYHHFINRLEALASLPAGNYCYFDSDVLLERPSSIIFSSIGEGLLVSTESGSRFEMNDVWLRQACMVAGVPVDLPDFPYVNSGILGFQLPRDKEFLDRLLAVCRRLFRGELSIMNDSLFPFLDQDVLNLLVRERIKQGGAVFSVSPRRVEIGNLDREHWDRPFPHAKQGDLRPRDRAKFLIHGASLRRPWIDATRPGLKGRLEAGGGLPLRRKWLKTLSPYERAWAHYACTDGMRISIDAWATRHSFKAHRNPLWRMAFGIGAKR